MKHLIVTVALIVIAPLAIVGNAAEAEHSAFQNAKKKDKCLKMADDAYRSNHVASQLRYSTEKSKVEISSFYGALKAYKRCDEIQRMSASR